MLRWYVYYRISSMFNGFQANLKTMYLLKILISTEKFIIWIGQKTNNIGLFVFWPFFDNI